MAGVDFRLPGLSQPLHNPETYVSSVLRNFHEAGQALGRALDLLVVRLAAPQDGSDPDYQIQTLDGEDAAAFSGETHALLHDDITMHIDEAELQDQRYTISDVEGWLNLLNGEGSGRLISPVLSEQWTEGDIGDPRD